MRPLSSTASAGVAGSPSAKRGTKPALVVALLAPSGAATPSMALCPKRSGVFERRFST